jgi:hypothetical protein
MSTPSERAAEIPGIIWQSILGGMAYHAYVARTEIRSHPDNAIASLAMLEDQIKKLQSFIIDGVRD